MLQYPNNEIENRKKSFLQDLINTSRISIGTRISLNEHPCTCVHINKNDYYFSFDEIFFNCEWEYLEEIIKEIYMNGNYNNIEIFYEEDLKDIDYIFIPDSVQLFGRDDPINDKQFDWYKKHGNLARVKGNFETGELTKYWTSNIDTTNQARVVNERGTHEFFDADDYFGVPIFFKMHKEV
jgi:hypothetical protein